jgi:hypothetical protein
LVTAAIGSARHRLRARRHQTDRHHKTLKGLSPAMAAEISPTLWSTTHLAEMVDAAEPKLGKRGSYKKAAQEV